jgi:hypothetical protein
MTRRFTRLVLAAVIAIGAVTSLNAIRAPQRGVQPAADMVLTNGTILTVTPRRHRAGHRESRAGASSPSGRTTPSSRASARTRW